ncbi:hypothetical protein FOA43_000695 [Brettanomyces nanus]|uniref:Lysophospholipase n=1 Tax=Eeniella nana TaxID=13502 RepID=A0A875RZB3_EENNA|nr:uncharacterized protein FOA43_000695 [Brettanomyces nanus]QPG73385.1 hypothetical protein FOA43_000695 [Brettanomyces nanus]
MFSGLFILGLIPAAHCWSPTDSYAPGIVDCPSYLSNKSYNTDDHIGFVRAASGLSQSESQWISSRDELTNKNLREFLDLADMEDFNSDDFMDDLSTAAQSNSTVRATPRIALSFSGGGYRAMLCAAGQISGLDSRTNGSSEYGVPILSSASYIAGLSGGSWFVSTLAYNNWTSVQDIIDQIDDSDAIWNLKHNIINPGGINILKTGSYWKTIGDDLDAKKDAGFNISLTDPWGRGLSYQFFTGLEDRGAAMTFSSLRNFPVFKNHSMPFPLVIADGRRPDSYVIDMNSTVFEFNPFEMGSWDPSLYSFADLYYVGTDIKKGKPVNDTCYAGLDNTGFVFGTSSTLFNQFILQLNTTGISGAVYSLINDFLENISDEQDDIAEWRPNPFLKSPWGSSDSLKNNGSLYLVDGGEDLQNIPLYPLIQPERNIDVVFAYDNSYDTDQLWPNGTSMIQTYQRQFGDQGNGTAFPYVPDSETFLKLNLTARPTFFGCYVDNLTSLMDDIGASSVPPLIVYTANRPFSFNSNTSTYKMSYETDEVLSMIQNGFEVSTRKNLTVDDEWRACVGCAILQRSREVMGTALGDQCKRCFDRYCWDGSIAGSNVTTPNAFTDDGMYYASNSTNGSSSNSVSSSGFATAEGNHRSSSSRGAAAINALPSADLLGTQDLPNRRKLDKQSPYVVARIQDQIQRTRVVPRGGQTPHFDQELWFSLDNVESSTINLMIYHQQKKDSELVCQADIDFSTALRRPVNEGYDAWFNLYYKGKPAGRIYLEMTYYNSTDSVPIGVGSGKTAVVPNNDIGKAFYTSTASRSSAGSDFPPGSTAKNLPLMTSYKQQLPTLPDLESIEDEDSPSDVSEPTSFDSRKKASVRSIGDSAVNKGWFSKIVDNAYSINKTIPSLFGVAQSTVSQENSKKLDDIKLNHGHGNKFQRQLSSPKLVKDIPRKLFVDSSDEEEGDESEINEERGRVEKRERMEQRRFTGQKGSELFATGQRVEFIGSAKGKPKHRPTAPVGYFDDSDDSDEEEQKFSSLRQSFKSKPLPKIQIHKKEAQHHLSDMPPPPPRHLIPTDLDSVLSSSSNIRKKFVSRDDKPRQVSESCKQDTLSYSQIRRMKLLGLVGN